MSYSGGGSGSYATAPSGGMSYASGPMPQVSGGYASSGPSYSAPQAGPSYSAPQAGPSYSAPQSSGPSYSAPSAPQPSAPQQSYSAPQTSGSSYAGNAARASKTLIADANCNSKEFKIILETSIVAGDANESKRRIHTTANEQFQSKNEKGIDVICAPSKISYRIATDLYCEHTVEDITCFVYQQV
jgi:hypothetical protein